MPTRPDHAHNGACLTQETAKANQGVSHRQEKTQIPEKFHNEGNIHPPETEKVIMATIAHRVHKTDTQGMGNINKINNITGVTTTEAAVEIIVEIIAEIIEQAHKEEGTHIIKMKEIPTLENLVGHNNNKETPHKIMSQLTKK